MVFTLFLFSLVLSTDPPTQQSGRGLQAWRESHCLRQKGMLYLKGKHETWSCSRICSSLLSRFSSFAVVRTPSMRDDLMISWPFSFLMYIGGHEQVVSNTSRKMSFILESSSFFSPPNGTLAHFCSKFDFSCTKVWKLEQHKEWKCCSLEPLYKRFELPN